MTGLLDLVSDSKDSDAEVIEDTDDEEDTPGMSNREAEKKRGRLGLVTRQNHFSSLHIHMLFTMLITGYSHVNNI
jgi:hypothetical protein